MILKDDTVQVLSVGGTLVLKSPKNSFSKNQNLKK